MKQYHSIEYYKDYIGLHIIAFNKIDGSNLRFEYSQKRGFYKFGTRNMMIDEKSEPFGFAIKLFLDKYQEGLTKIFKSKDYRDIQSFVCYAELHGPKSEFGQHDFINDKFDITLFDVDRYKKGFVEPKKFVEDFQHLGIPTIYYIGNLTKEFINVVKKSNFFEMDEGERFEYFKKVFTYFKHLKESILK